MAARPPVGRDDSARRRTGFRPAGRVSFPAMGKKPKDRRGRLTSPSGTSSPPPPVRSPPDPRNLRGPNSGGLPVTVRRGKDNDCPRNRAAAAVAVAPKSRRPGQLDQTGAPDCSRSNLCGRRIGGRVWDPPLRGNFCHTRYDGRRSHRTTSVAPYSMKGPEIAVRAGPGPPAVRGL